MKPKSLSVRMAILAIASLAALILAAQQGAAADGGFKATVERKGGMAKVIFQPASSSNVNFYSRDGQKLGELSWAASFEVSVTEQTLRAATTKEGIDVHSLLEGMGPIDVADKMLIKAELPYTVKTEDGTELPRGTEVYFGLNRLAKEDAMVPVAAWGGKMGRGGAANEFNDRLLDKGVRGQAQKPEASVKSEKPSRQSHTHAREGVHGTPNTPLEADQVNDVADIFDTKILSAPTCIDSSSQSMRTTSYWGRRKTFRTSNGARATSWHDGLDIAGKAGTPVVAAADGCVKVKDMRFNTRSGYGLTVVLEHANGLSTQYSHMQNFSPAIREFARTARNGEKYCVKRGEQIGAVGRTGNCTGPHLHFGVRKDGRSVNPRQFMRASSNGDLSNTCEELQAKNAYLKPLDQALAQGATRDGRMDKSSVSAQGRVTR